MTSTPEDQQPKGPQDDTVDGGSEVAPETQGPPQNPPSHGVPGNPTQPRG